MSGKLPAATPKDVIGVLERCGWRLDRVKGSHHLYRHPDSINRVVVLLHVKDLPKGTLHGILADAGISREEFQKLL